MTIHDLTPGIATHCPPAPPAPAQWWQWPRERAAWFLASPALALIPEPVRSGKLSGDDAADMVRVEDTTRHIADHAPYDEKRPGCDGGWSEKLREALAVDLTLVVSVHDSGVNIAINETGTRAAIL